MFPRLLICTLLGTLILSAPALAHANAGMQFLAKVDEAGTAGELSSEEALLYKFYYAFDPEKLPAAFQPTEFSPLKCGTLLIREYEHRRDELSRTTVRIIDQLLTPPAGDDKTPESTYISGGGIFRLTYFLSGGNAVPATDINPANGIPDYVEKIAGYLDYCWDYEILTLGFPAPPHYPYYEIGFENMPGLYGYTQPIGGLSTYIVLHNTFTGFPPNDDPEGNVWGAAKVTCAHEFKHASQWVESHWSEGGWNDLDATAMEEFAYDVVNDYYNYIWGNSPIRHPELPLDHGGTGSYEDCVWEIWMQQTYGIQIIVDFGAWRAGHTAEPVMDSYEQVFELYGSTLQEAWSTFTAWNYATGNRTITGLGYDEAADYPVGPLTGNVYSYPNTVSGSVDHLAADFIRCANFGSSTDVLEIDFNGQNGASLGLSAVIKRLDGSGEIQVFELDENNDLYLQLPIPANELDLVGLVVNNSDKIGLARSYTLNLDVAPYVPIPSLDVDVTSVAMNLQVGQVNDEVINLTNNGEAGSVLNYSIALSHEVPTAMAPPSGSRALRPDNLGKRYPGECVFGNDNFGNHFATQTSFWSGNESYAFFINPADYTCACDPGFNVRGVHMWLDLSTSSHPTVRAHLAEAEGGGSCFTPGAILSTSDPFTVSVGSNGLHDVEIPCDFACQEMNVNYFLIVEFLDANGPVGLPFDNSSQDCVNYVERGGGWEDLVDVHNFWGDIYIWADVDCCSDFEPEVRVLTPNGGESWGVGLTHEITWYGLMLDDVKIEVSRDSGNTWESITASTPNDGSYLWTVNLPQTTTGLVRISSLDGQFSDLSDGVFNIYQPVTWLTADPATGAIAQGATQQVSLTFDATGLVPDTYAGYVIVNYDGPDTPTLIPVTLVVTSPLDAGETPVVFNLEGNYPNPFNPQTTIAFTLPTAGPVTLEVLDMRGRLVRTVYQGDLPRGTHRLDWDGRDAVGRIVAAGTYFARLQAPGHTATDKMVLAK